MPYALNPARVSEYDTFPDMDIASGSYLDATPWHLDVWPDPGADWDRDGVYGGPLHRDVPLRAAANGRICRAYSEDWQNLTTTHILGAPAFVRLQDHVYAFYVGASSASATAGVLTYDAGEIGPASNGSCFNAENPYDRPVSVPENDRHGGCVQWRTTGPSSLFEAHGTSVTALTVGSEVVVAMLRDDGSIRVRRYAACTGTPSLLCLQPGSQTVVPAGGGADPDGGVELDWMYASTAAGVGWTERVALVYRHAASGEYRALYDQGGTFVDWPGFGAGAVVPGLSGTHTLGGSGHATLAPWPDRHAAFFADARTTCAVFPTATGGLRPYCFDPDNAHWVDLSDTVFGHTSTNSSVCHVPTDPQYNDAWRWWEATLGQAGRCAPRSDHPPDLVFSLQRYDGGTPVGESSGLGRFQLVTTRPNDPAVRMWLSGRVSNVAGYRPMDGAWTFERQHAPFMNGGLQLENGSAVRQLTDADMGAVFALGAVDGDNNDPEVLTSFPHADGSMDLDLYVESDFRIMEDYLCRFIANKDLLGPVTCSQESTVNPPNVFE